MENRSCVIVGYDLTNFKTAKFDKWAESKDGLAMTTKRSTGDVQLFIYNTDRESLYLGCIMSPDTNTEPVYFDNDDMSDKFRFVKEKLDWLVYKGVIEKNVDYGRYGVIAFTEFA